MGNTCGSNTGESSGNFCCGAGGGGNAVDNWDPEDLKLFQRIDIKVNELSKYDQFYRFTGMPFIRMGIKEFIADLDSMGDKIEWKTTKDETGKSFQTETCTVKDFMAHFKDKEKWKMYIQDPASSFLKLLFVDNLFIID